MLVPVFYSTLEKDKPLSIYRNLYGCLAFTSELTCHARQRRDGLPKGLGEYVYTVLKKKKGEEVFKVGLELSQVTKYSDSHAASFVKFFGEAAAVTDWKSVFEEPSIKESIKEDPAAQSMMSYLQNRISNQPTSMDVKQLVHLSNSCQVTIFSDKRMGEIFKYLYIYFCKFGRNDDINHALPYLSFMMLEYYKMNGLPYFILAELDPNIPTQVGMNMYWPLKFNLLMEPFRFSNEWEAPYYEEMDPFSIDTELNYVLLMTGVRYFLCCRLQKHRVVFTAEEFNYAMRNPRVRQNLFTFLGFALD